MMLQILRVKFETNESDPKLQETIENVNKMIKKQGKRAKY